MPLRDRFRRLRKGSVSADNSPPSALTPEAGSSTGEATPAITQTPTVRSTTDLSTIGEVLTHQATLKQEAEGKKKKRGLFKRKNDPYKDWPDDVYKPHEVPAPKYKRAPDPRHLENLSAFSFGGGNGSRAGDFLRRFSVQSGISPGGSKMASRAGSRMASANPSRNPSVVDSADKEDSGLGSSPSTSAGPAANTGKALRPGLANRMGTSRPNAPHGEHEPDIGEGDEDETMSRQRTADSNKENQLETAKALSRSSNDMPFTQQELTQALTKATITGDAGTAAES